MSLFPPAVSPQKAILYESFMKFPIGAHLHRTRSVLNTLPLGKELPVITAKRSASQRRVLLCSGCEKLLYCLGRFSNMYLLQEKQFFKSCNRKHFKKLSSAPSCRSLVSQRSCMHCTCSTRIGLHASRFGHHFKLI